MLTAPFRQAPLPHLTTWHVLPSYIFEYTSIHCLMFTTIMSNVLVLLQAGVPNLLDKGVLSVGTEKGLHKNVKQEWTFLDEIPFDFERRMLSVMLRPAGKGQAMLITKV